MTDPSSELETALARIAELEALVYVPGLWRCAKCGLQVVATNLHVNIGRMSANNEPRPCENGCGPMWRVSEREAGNRLCAQAETAAERIRELEAQLGARSSVVRAPCPDCHDGGACLPGGCGADGCERCGKLCPTCNGSCEVRANVPALRLELRHPDDAPIGDEHELLFCFGELGGKEYIGIGYRCDSSEWCDAALDELVDHAEVRWFAPVAELLARSK